MKRKILFFSLMLTFLFASCSNLIDELTVTKEKEANYTVTISDKIENGTVTANPTTAAAGTEITLAAEAASGYSFGSYSVTDTDGNSVKVENGKFKMPASNVNVSAIFTAVTYTVTVASNIVNGTVTANPTTAAAGSEITLTVTPATGYQFATLTVTNAGGNAVTVTDNKFTMPKSNVTVSATFKETAETVNQKAAATVIAKITAIGTVEYTDESKAKIVEARTAYDALTETQKALISAETLAVLTNAESTYGTLKAAAEQQTATYTVKIASGIANGTVTASPTTAAASMEITLAAEAASGYTFGSYTVTDADGKAVTVTDNKFTMPASNVNVSATFTAVTYTVTVASDIVNGTVTASPTTAAAGTEITLSVTPATGYQFATLTVTDAGGNAVTVTDNKFTMPASNVTVSATFTALPPATASYTVKHLQQNIADNNYTLKESETKTGTVGQPTDASAKSYEGFTAQAVTQVTVAASGTEVEIKYDRKSYTVTFDSNGGSDVSSQSLRYEAKATEPAVPSKNGFVFIGWYSDTGLESAFNFDTAITGDITLYAKWMPSGIYTENSAYYINVDSQSSPSDGNGAW